jgi:hypothetical protein
MQYRDVEQDVFSEALCDKIRAKLKLTEFELPNKVIKDVVIASNKSIADWILNNADGYEPMPKSGVLAVSRMTPYNLKPYKDEAIERIKANSTISQSRKEKLIRKYEGKNKTGFKLKPNIKGFFHVYKVMWFNMYCNVDKASLYAFDFCKKERTKLGQKIREGRQYIDWVPNDFRIPKAELKRGFSRKTIKNETKHEVIDKLKNIYNGRV